MTVEGLPVEHTTDPAVLGAYRTDFANFCPSGTAAALVRARNVDEVAATLRWAHEHRVPVVPQGARTGLAGGANAIDGCILLSLERMNQIVEIDPDEQLAVVQPGVINGTLAAAAAEQNLFYPPDPGSRDISSLGGNVATNAGGMCCVKYGVTRSFVRALQVVLADGRVMRTGTRTAKGVAGYDLTGLFIGSEGTLGVITEATLALRPAAARPLTAVAFFDTAADACQAVADYLQAGHRPSVLELMEANIIEAISQLADLGFPPTVGAVLICQSDAGAAAADELAAFGKAATGAGATEVIVADDPAEGDLLMQARRLAGLAMERLGAMLVEDVCVPRRRMVEFATGLERISSEHGVRVSTVAHAGDGNFHPNVTFDRDDADEVARARQAFDDIMRLGLDLGGTITGEHGVGILKAGWLWRELDEPARWAHQQLKQALDPRGILNPGRVVS